MDIDAHDWNREVLSRCSLPFATMLFLTILILLLAPREKVLRAYRESEEKFSKAFYYHPTAMQIVDIKSGERLWI